MDQKGFAPIFVIIGLLLFVVVSGVLYAIKTNKPVHFPPLPAPTAPPGAKYELRGSEVIRIHDGKEFVLFKNVKNVQKVRLGPDQKTLHFKVSISTSNEAIGQYCANLEDIPHPLPVDVPNDPLLPPKQPPWDYQKIGHAYTINLCNNRGAGGYLKNSDYFVYLVLYGSKTGDLIYEDLSTGQTNRVQVGEKLLAGFYNLEPQLAKVNNYWTDEIVDKQGYNYYYPHQDLKVQDHKLVLAFGRLILPVDTQTNRLMGGVGLIEADYKSIAGTSFVFLNKNSLPYIVVEGRWEGSFLFATLLDVSGDNLKVINLSDLDKRSPQEFQIEPLIWGKDSLVFNFTDFEDATDRLPPQLKHNLLNTHESTEPDIEGIVAEKYLMDTGRYQEVKCSPGPGMVAGCDGLKGIIKYRYNSTIGLTKI